MLKQHLQLHSPLQHSCPSLLLPPQLQARSRCLRTGRAIASSATLIIAVLISTWTNAARAEATTSSIRGVAPHDQVRYAPSSADGSFHCFLEAAETGVLSRPLPLSAVNDDFCDCPDGSDEPGTSACAGQQKTLFYCPNDQSIASYIYTSHVNDGFCDCCDGSDEWSTSGPSACPNTCASEGKELRRELQKKEADWRSGVQKRQQLIDSARKARESERQELSKLRETLPSLEVEENRTLAVFEEAKSKHEEELKDQEAQSQVSEEESADTIPEQSVTDSPSDNDLQESKVANDGDPAEQDTGKGVVSEYTKWMDGAEKVLDGGDSKSHDDPQASEIASESAAADEDTGSGTVSEYTKWMDGAEKVLPGEKHSADAKDVEKEDDEGWLSRQWRSFSSMIQRSMGDFLSLFGLNKTPLERARDAAQKELNAARKKVGDANARISELQRKIGEDDSEERLAYAALEGKCLSNKFSEYKYEACFFKNAKQDSTSIGEWRRWESSHIGIFDGGQYCPGGPERSLRVVFICGSKEEILDVTEPSRCTYETRISHPAACSGEGPSEASMQRARMPTEEL